MNEFWPARDPLRILNDVLDALPERIVDNAGSGAWNLDPFSLRPLHGLVVELPVLAANLGRARASVHESPNIRFILQGTTHTNRIPAPAVECGDAVIVQLTAD